MDKEIIRTSDVPEKIVSQDNHEFTGYSLEELRYQRALVALQKEFCKSKVMNGVRKVQKNGISGASTSTGGKAMGIFGKFLTGMSYVDYALLGLSMFRSGKKVYSFFRRKK